MLPQSWRLIDGVLDERSPDTATAVGRSHVVGDFGGSSERRATRPISTERAPGGDGALALGDVDGPVGRIMIVEPRRSLVDGDGFEVGGCKTLLDGFVVDRDDRRKFIDGCGANSCPGLMFVHPKSISGAIGFSRRAIPRLRPASRD